MTLSGFLISLAQYVRYVNVLFGDGPIESVSKMLGHSSLKHTMLYARIVGEKIKADMEYVKGIFS